MAKIDKYHIKRLEVTFQMTCLHIQLEHKIDVMREAKKDVSEQEFKLKCLKEGINLIHLLEEENRNLKKQLNGSSIIKS